jgi:riboflavin synthase
MFTGLVEEVGRVRRIEPGGNGARLTIAARRVLEDVRLGDSISVNGVCLTVTSFGAGEFSVEAVPETMRRTNLGRLRPNDPVNLERALRLSDRLGGHIVSGHVDGTGRLVSRTPEGLAVVLTIEAPGALMKYIVEKGSICVDGVSLTVMDTDANRFRVSIIPHTGSNTTLLTVPVGWPFNLECDVLAKYVESLLTSRTGAGGAAEPDGGARRDIPLSLLRDAGYL